MTASVSDLSNILKNAGLKVDVSLARSGESGSFSPLGLIYHHDAAGLSYTDNWNGRDNITVAKNMSAPGSNGAQFWVGRSGTWYILSSGKKWHAGTGDGYGRIPANSGNVYAYGIETDYGPVRSGWSGGTIRSAGYTWPVWDKVHQDSINTGAWALAKGLGLNTFCAHKEYAPTRKIDVANVDLNAWRKFISTGPTTPPEDDTLKLDADDQKFIEDTVNNAINKALYVSTDDAAVDGNPNKYTVATGVARIIRLTSMTYNRIVGAPDR